MNIKELEQIEEVVSPHDAGHKKGIYLRQWEVVKFYATHKSRSKEEFQRKAEFFLNMLENGTVDAVLIQD